MYLHADLSRADWAKVLAWACSMDHVLRTKGAKVWLGTHTGMHDT